MRITKFVQLGDPNKIVKCKQPKSYEINFNNVQGLSDVIELLKELNLVISEDHYNNTENKYLFKALNYV